MKKRDLLVRLLGTDEQHEPHLPSGMNLVLTEIAPQRWMTAQAALVAENPPPKACDSAALTPPASGNGALGTAGNNIAYLKAETAGADPRVPV